MDRETDDDLGLKLQKVLTRYVDSKDGYTHAAEIISNKTLAAIFLEIAENRAAIIPRLAKIMEAHGQEPQAVGSVEGSVHRWWMSIRDELAKDELKNLLIECIRGESALLEALDESIQFGKLLDEDMRAIEMVRVDVEKAVSHFTAAVHDKEFVD